MSAGHAHPIGFYAGPHGESVEHEIGGAVLRLAEAPRPDFYAWARALARDVGARFDGGRFQQGPISVRVRGACHEGLIERENDWQRGLEKSYLDGAVYLDAPAVRQGRQRGFGSRSKSEQGRWKVSMQGKSGIAGHVTHVYCPWDFR